jgi:hypothetical protein
MSIQTGIDSRYWKLISSGMAADGTYYFPRFTAYPGNTYEYVAVVCTAPVNIFAGLELYFYKINP